MLRIILTTLLLAGGLLAHEPPVEFYRTHNHLTGAVSSMVGGHFSNGFDPDVAYIDSGELVLAYGPGLYSNQIASGVVATDIARAEGRGTFGDDAIARVGPDGLWLTRYDPAASGFSHSLVSDGPGWSSVRQVLVSPHDPYVFVGLTGVGRVALVHRETTGETTSFALAAPAHDLTLLDWDGDGDDELLAATQVGLEVVDTAGTTLDLLPLTIHAGSVTALDETGSAGQRAAAVVRLEAGGNDMLVVGDTAGWEAAVNLGSIDAFGVVAGDWYGDGDEDLVVLNRAVHDPPSFRPLVCANEQAAGGPTFSPGGTTFLDMDALGQPDSAQQAGCVLDDFSRDGDVDLLTYSAADDALRLLRNTEEDHTSHALPIFDFHLLGSPAAASLQITFLQPGSELPGATHLMISQWDAQFADTGLSAELLPSGLAVDLLPLALDQDVQCPLPQFDVDVLRYVQANLAVVDGQGEVTDVGPATHVILLAGSNLVDQLEAIYGPVMESCGTCLVGGSLDPGGLINPPKPPRYDDDEEVPSDPEP